MKKPSWMKLETWHAFLDANGAFVCRVCGTTEEDLHSVDHIVARAAGGTDDVSNLQWMCTICNCRKGGRPDRYWEKHFYFDHNIDLSKLRTAQRSHAYERVNDYSSWFARPWSQINQFLYVLVWIVGAGKTLGILTMAFALNEVVRKFGVRGAPRVDRLLVLCKEEAVRGQLAKSLREDGVKYGIIGAEPRVLEVTSGSQWQREKFQDYDIVVACIQQLWSDEGRVSDKLGEILNWFPLVAIDEPHYAFDQVMRLVRSGSNSIFIGTTGSPIEASGDSLARMVMFSVYGYDDASTYDHSMKFLTGPDDAKWSDCVTEIPIDSADILEHGRVRTTDTTQEKDYARNLEPAKSVAEAVVQYVHDSDDLKWVGMARHRELANTRADNDYPMHALIVADSIGSGKHLTQMLNRMFDANRRRYPVQNGYRAEMVSTASPKDGVEAKKLDTVKHDWMFARHNGGKLSAKSARFLVVVGIGREGVDNPMCGVVGVACSSVSTIEGVQRWIGRQIRSVVRWSAPDENPVLHVPVARKDTVKIITHESYDNMGVIRASVDFVLNMPSKVADLISMDALVGGDAQPGVSSVATDVSLTIADRLAIAGALGEAKRLGQSADIDDLVRSMNPLGKPAREAKVREWIEEVTDNPHEASKRMFHVTALEAVQVVMHELPVTDPSDADLVAYLNRSEARLRFVDRLGETDIRELVVDTYREHAATFNVGEFTTNETVDDIRRSIAAEAFRSFAPWYKGPADRGIIHGLVGAAVKQIFGTTRPVANKSEWDNARCHAILHRPEIRTAIQGFVRSSLMSKGMLPALSAAFGIPSQEAAA